MARATGSTLLGAYRPGSSPLHRAGAGLKLGVLCAGLLTLALLRSPLAVGVAAGLVIAATAIARVGWAALAAQVRPVLPFAAFAAALQLWFATPADAVVITGALLIAVAAAGLVTLTTRTQELLDALVSALRPLRRVGVDPERVALLLALTIRSVPVLAGLVHQVQEARAARGAQRSIRALAAPVLIRTLRHADQLGEALAARGIGDE